MQQSSPLSARLNDTWRFSAGYKQVGLSEAALAAGIGGESVESYQPGDNGKTIVAIDKVREQKTASQVQAAGPKALPTDRSAKDSRQIALAIPTVAGGGAERAMLNLAAAFSARGHRVDLVVCRANGELRNEVPNGVKLVELRRGTWTWSRLRVLEIGRAHV